MKVGVALRFEVALLRLTFWGLNVEREIYRKLHTSDETWADTLLSHVHFIKLTFLSGSHKLDNSVYGNVSFIETNPHEQTCAACAHSMRERIPKRWTQQSVYLGS